MARMRAWRGAQRCMELGGPMLRQATGFSGFANASMAQGRRSSITQNNIIMSCTPSKRRMVDGVTSTAASSPGTHRCHRPPNTKYQSGEGSGGGGFLSFSTSSA